MTYTPEQIKANIQAVIDWLESPAAQDEFDMSEWNCGTVMCIGGFIEANFFGHETHQEKCGELIGLDYWRAHHLFNMPHGDHDLSEVTSEIAAQCMRNLRDHAVVDWDRAFEEVEGEA